MLKSRCKEDKGQNEKNDLLHNGMLSASEQYMLCKTVLEDYNPSNNFVPFYWIYADDRVEKSVLSGVTMASQEWNANTEQTVQMCRLIYLCTLRYQPAHHKTYNTKPTYNETWVTSKDSDQPV